MSGSELGLVGIVSTYNISIGETASLICNFNLPVAVRTIGSADSALRYTSTLHVAGSLGS